MCHLTSFSQFTGLGSGGYDTYAMFNECSSLQGVCINGGVKLNIGYMFRNATSIDETRRVVAMTPTTPDSLVKALNLAPLFKNHLDLDTRISVTNMLDLTGVTIDSTAVSGVTFDRLMFSAKTQAQLNAILHAFPATTPISIDPTGLTEADVPVAATRTSSCSAAALSSCRPVRRFRE